MKKVYIYFFFKCNVKDGHHNFPETKVTSPNRHLLSNSQELKYSSTTIIKDEEKQRILTFKNLEPPNVKKKMLLGKAANFLPINS